MTSLEVTNWVLVGVMATAFIVGLVTRNYSTVDRLWSILPAVFALVWLPPFIDNPRFVIAAFLVVLWSARLTTNFALRGGYVFRWPEGFVGEDYRWKVVRKGFSNPVAWQLFHLFFICGFQLALIFAFTRPLFEIGSATAALGVWDVIFFSLWAALLTTEGIADIQNLRYFALRASPAGLQSERVSLGFNTMGLWKYSRHPNFVCEMGQWLLLAAFAFQATGKWHWSYAGSAVLVLLFAGSTRMTESITASKYPAYSEWKKVTPPWLPSFRSKARDAFLRRLSQAAHAPRHFSEIHESPRMAPAGALESDPQVGLQRENA